MLAVMNEEQIMLIQAKIIFSLLLFMLMVFIFCNNSKNDSIYLNYSKNYNSCNKEGIPNDSLIEYFPSFLFNQKEPSILFGESIVYPLAGRTKEEFSKDLKGLNVKIQE